MSHKKFLGIFPPMSTFLDAGQNFDEQAQAKMIDHLIDAGVQGILILGSAGEFFAMSTAQRKQVAEFCLKYINGRVSALVNTGACSLSETIELTAHAAANRADGVLVINPYYTPLSEECLFDHYCKVATASPIPVLLYNFPAMTKQALSVELVARLAAAHSNIQGIKDSVADVLHTRRIILEVASQRDDFSVFSGFDEQLLNTLALGGAGGIPGTANFAPEVAMGLYNAFRQGEFAKAHEFHRAIAGLSDVYAIETPYFGTLKAAVNLRHQLAASEEVIPPSRMLSSAGKQKLQELLRRYRLI